MNRTPIVAAVLLLAGAAAYVLLGERRAGVDDAANLTALRALDAQLAALEADVADLNTQLRAWCERVNGKHKRTIKARPIELFATERGHLKPLPRHIPEVYALWRRTVDEEGYVHLHTNRYSVPETSSQEHELMTRHAETLLQRLGLPYRVKLLAAGDTGFASAKTYDLETYAPGVGAWLEVSSSSTFTDFQARRANIRFRPAAGGKPRFVHTLNASGLAFPRIIATVIEHYQRADGTVVVPEVLRPYLGTDTIR